MVNGILGYPDNDQYAAPINEAGKLLDEPRGYRHPDLRKMVLWDMPGAGTTDHPGSTYFEDKYLQVFDSLIIVTAERLLIIVNPNWSCKNTHIEMILIIGYKRSI